MLLRAALLLACAAHAAAFGAQGFAAARLPARIACSQRARSVVSAAESKIGLAIRARREIAEAEALVAAAKAAATQVAAEASKSPDDGSLQDEA
eukprot:4301303-Prymnesium_polylepis.1